MFRLIGKILFFFIRFIIHLPFAVFHGLRRFFFGVNFDKMNGYEFEEYAARYLKRNGYSKITVTKASRDFGVDLIAKKHRTTYAVQCKLYQGKVGNSAVQEAVAGKSYYDCDEAMVITNSVFYPGAIALAKANDVTLIDGAQLKRRSFRWGRFFRIILLLLLCGLLIFCITSPETALI